LDIGFAHFRVFEYPGDAGEVQCRETKEEIEVELTGEGVGHEEAK